MSSIGNNYTPFYVTDADLEPSLRSRATALSYMSNRNRVINGAMEIDQRRGGASVVVSNTSVYTLDRWLVGCSGNLSAQRTGSVAANAITLTGGAGGATAVNLIQRIEAINIADLAGKVVTLSFVASSPTLTSLPWRVDHATLPDDFTAVSTIQSGTLAITSSPTRYSVQFTLPAGAVNGVAACPILGAALPSGVSVSISNVQLEEGSVPTSFERRDHSQELSMCQRYFWMLTGPVMLQTPASPPGSGWVIQQYINFPTQMRVPPSVTAVFTSPINVATQGVQSVSTTGFQPYATSATGSNYHTIYASGNTASAEL